MDVMSFLKTVPAVIGIAGLLTYFMRARAPVSDHELVTAVNRVRNTFLLLGCAALIMLSVWLILRPAPPDHDAALPTPTTIGNAGTPAKALVRSDGVVFDGFNQARVIDYSVTHAITLEIVECETAWFRAISRTGSPLSRRLVTSAAAGHACIGYGASEQPGGPELP